jgi:glyoxylase-like metal-dependent hydrolase (beta-lactamase superfamily II)
MDKLALQFLGAARHVTGTKHLLEIGDSRVLLDCGLVQGPRKVAEDAQNRKLPIAGRDVDALVLSHAHIDHCGALPRLVKDGYAGPIWCTDATGRHVADDADGLRAHPGPGRAPPAQAWPRRRAALRRRGRRAHAAPRQDGARTTSRSR